MTGLDDGLRRRFRLAGAAIAWRSAPGGGGPGDRIAHLHDEEGRVRVAEAAGGVTITADPGPVGALVLLLEIEARGLPEHLMARDAGASPFPGGALLALWGSARPPADARAIRLEDLVAVARYALA